MDQDEYQEFLDREFGGAERRAERRRKLVIALILLVFVLPMVLGLLRLLS